MPHGNPRPDPASKPRVVLIDDHAEFLQATADFLAVQREFDVAGCFSRGDEAIKFVQRQPDRLIVVTDLVMPGLSGLDVARLLRLAPLPPAVVILSLDVGPGLHALALSAGAAAVLQKGELGERLLPTLHGLAADSPG
jgi:DNA-binding NarL/FixJ family response regulator